MSAAAVELQKGVFAALAGDAELAALLGGARVFDGPPRNALPPYVHLGEASVRDWSTGTEDGFEVRFAVIAWSETAGRMQALRLAERVRTVLADADLAPDGLRLVNLTHLGTETGRAEKPEGRRAVARFRAVVEVA